MDGVVQSGGGRPNVVYAGTGRRGHAIMATLFGAAQPPLRAARALQPHGGTDGLQAHLDGGRVSRPLRGPATTSRATGQAPARPAFTAGLGPPLSIDVQVQNPHTVILAMNLVRTLEQREPYYTTSRPSSSTTASASHKAGARGLLQGAPPVLALPAPATIEGRQLRRLSQTEMEARKRLGLCFNCDEKFQRGHSRVCKRAFLLELWEDDTPEEPVGDPTDTEEPHISLLAMVGVRSCDTMQVRIKMGGIVLLALLDSGSTHNFISEDAASRTALQLQPGGNMRVTVANGERVPCLGIYRAATFSIDDEHFQADLFALPLAGYDVVLGTQWLASLGPILWDFWALTMSFWHGDHCVRWQGVEGPSSPGLRACSADGLMAALLDEFGSIFTEPEGMPPPRSRDHAITLVPGAQPVAVRPYRYPAAHKDELERQCTSMLAQGLIRRGSSAFSSPVLLVKKADSSWRFCIDYRALNAITVKDAYPIPVVDELLDELHGARFFTKLDLCSGYHQEMTLEEYEKVLEEKRKALLALKAEERKVEIDKELQSMQQLSVKKDADEVFIKLGSDKDLKKKDAEREERAKKSLNINEFLKPAEGERYYNPSGRGRGRGRGRGDSGGFRGGYNGGYQGQAAAPSIEDQAQFPALA